jgi:hypothetical protein
VQLDHVAERIVHEDLLRLGTDHPAAHPVRHAHPVQLRLRLLDVGHRESHVRARGVLVRALGELGLTLYAHEMDLGIAAHVHPVAVDGGDRRAPLVGVETEHVVIEAVGFLHVGRRGPDADAVVVELEHFDGHGCLP